MGDSATPFDGFDFSRFWKKSEYADRLYTDKAPTTKLIMEVEEELGYKIPAAYKALAAYQNGGYPIKDVHRTTVKTTWANDHIAIQGIFSIGREKPMSLCGANGSEFWPTEWGYPEIGIYFADCPSAGHDMLCLDYRACGPDGEPTVVHVDQEWDYRITLIAPNFEAFIRGLEGSEAFQ